MFRVSIYTFTSGSRLPQWFGSVSVFEQTKLTPKLALRVLRENGISNGAAVCYEYLPGESGIYAKPVTGYRVYGSGRTRKLDFSSTQSKRSAR